MAWIDPLTNMSLSSVTSSTKGGLSFPLQTAADPEIVLENSSSDPLLRTDSDGNLTNGMGMLMPGIVESGSAVINATVDQGVSADLAQVNLSQQLLAGDMILLDTSNLSTYGWGSSTGGVIFNATFAANSSSFELVGYNTDLVNTYTVTGTLFYMILRP
jgi:hypothetical protein